MPDLRSRPRVRGCLVLGLFTVFAAGRAAGQGVIEHLEPPAVQTGATTTLTVVGTGFNRGVGLWTALPAGNVTATPGNLFEPAFPVTPWQWLVAGALPPPGSLGRETPGRRVRFDVAVSPGAPVGVTGVRAATLDGLGNAALLLVDDLPVRPAPPPVPGQPPPVVSLPVSLWGRFRAAEIDRFQIEVAPGQPVSFEVVANRLGKEVDPLVIIRDAAGRIVADCDNSPGLMFDCRFEHRFLQGGKYVVELRDSRFHGAEHGLYVLRMGRFPAARVALPAAVRPGAGGDVRLPELGGLPVHVPLPAETAPGRVDVSLRGADDDGSTWVPVDVTDLDVTTELEPNNTVGQGTRAAVPGVLCGILGEPGDKDYFLLDLGRNQRLVVRGEARGLNSPADLELVLTDVTGRELTRSRDLGDDVVGFEFTAGTPGPYGLMVRDLARDGGPAFAYRVRVSTSQPSLHVTADVEGLTVPRGNYQPVPVVVRRGDGEYAGPVELHLLDAPPGVTLIPPVIPARADRLVCSLAAGPATPLGLFTVRIEALPTEFRPPARPVPVRTRPLIDRQLKNVDLIPYALREDQRRLPAGLTDRFALMVTPPAPFDAELPAASLDLPRFQHVDLPLRTTRVPGFRGPISFDARGGVLGPKAEFRSQLFAEFEDATPDRPDPVARFRTRNLIGFGLNHLTVEATAEHDGRRVTLRRACDVKVLPAYAVRGPSGPVIVRPGESAVVTLTATRAHTFDGDITFDVAPTSGLTLPEKLVIGRGRDQVEFEVKALPTAGPQRTPLSVVARALVSGFEEEQRSNPCEIEVRPPPQK